MKNFKAAIFIIVVVLLTIATAHAQRKFTGRVVDVVDGKTCVIELPAGKVTAVLQYIEIPEPEQPLYDTVKQHLGAILIGKNVEFAPRVILADRTIGQMMLGGVDVSQQMIRDGAAWHSEYDKESQEASERAAYEDNQAQAKTEKLGVWGVPNLKPAWEFRAELERKAEQDRKDALEKVRLESMWKQNGARQKAPVGIAPEKVGPTTDLFVNPIEQDKYDKPFGIGGLRTAVDPLRGITFIATPTIFIDFPTAGFITKANARLVYAYRSPTPYGNDSIHYVAIAAGSKTAKLSKSTPLVVVADGRKIAFSKTGAYRSKSDKEGTLELIFYTFKSSDLQKIAAAKSFFVQLGPYKGTISAESMELIRNLASTTTN